MKDFDDFSKEEQFSVRVNLAMAKAIKDGADVDTIARIAANTAYELYEHYGAGEDYDTFPAFVVDVAFQVDEIEHWLDEQEE